jgi:hypothetical protein
MHPLRPRRKRLIQARTPTQPLPDILRPVQQPVGPTVPGRRIREPLAMPAEKPPPAKQLRRPSITTRTAKPWPAATVITRRPLDRHPLTGLPVLPLAARHPHPILQLDPMHTAEHPDRPHHLPVTSTRPDDGAQPALRRHTEIPLPVENANVERPKIELRRPPTTTARHLRTHPTRTEIIRQTASPTPTRHAPTAGHFQKEEARLGRWPAPGPDRPPTSEGVHPRTAHAARSRLPEQHRSPGRPARTAHGGRASEAQRQRPPAYAPK